LSCFLFSSRRRHTRFSRDWSSDVCSSDLYTSKILIAYLKCLKVETMDNKLSIFPIHIHGDLNDPENPIIFGYGDENSKEYHELRSEERRVGKECRSRRTK